ncbi:MAG: SDR family oxidoreductase, partial [Pseudomonadota bacterium]
MKALLTGASGFVGRNLLLHWLTQNQYEQIILPVRNSKKLIEQLHKEGISDLSKVLIKESSAPEWAGLQG